MGTGSIFGKLVVALSSIILIVIFGAVAVSADNPKSSNYEMSESEFNSGLTLESCSDNYCAKVSIGDSNAIAGSGTAVFEDLANNDPVLEVIIEPGESNLGVLNTSTTATKTMGVKIRNHLSGGYTLQIIGEPPKLDGHTLKHLETQTPSMPGVEQFGMNVVANTTPSIGLDPVQNPDTGVVFGEPDSKYSVPNQFRFVSGDVVARGLSDSGRTDYTITMIVNVANTTPAGHYWSDFMAMVIPSF